MIKLILVVLGLILMGVGYGILGGKKPFRRLSRSAAPIVAAILILAGALFVGVAALLF